MRLFKIKPYLVWHVRGEAKIVVFRNWLQVRLFKDEINSRETDYSFEPLACAIDLTTF